jgi:hypothetical protein
MFEFCFKPYKKMNTATLPSASKPAPKIPETRPPKPRRNHWWLILFVFAGIYAAFNVEDFDFLVEKDGGYDLSPQRKKKHQKEIEELDNAEQYVIYALKPGYYPCYNCGHLSLIYLNFGEVWKYGVTKIGQNRRYSIGEIPENLQYKREYTGDYGTCLKLEKYKIYHYALLPENLSRDVPLIRPPGNKVDL